MKKSNKSDTLKKAMLRALEKSLGVVCSACNAVGIARKTHYEWMKKDLKYASAVDGVTDIGLDFAESALLKAIKTGNVTAIIFYLKTKGKKRGYVERREIATNLKNDNKIILK